MKTVPKPDAPYNLTQREPKSPMIASLAADDCKLLRIPCPGQPEAAGSPRRLLLPCSFEQIGK